MAAEETVFVKSLYDLPTFQRRLRHVRSISLKNLQCKSYKGKDITRLEVYFTLHVNNTLKEFYRSEVITGSLNPSWKSFDISIFDEVIDIQAKYFYLRVWVKDGSSAETVPYVLTDWHINLSGLVFFSDKLQQDKYKNIPNMVMVGMFDKYFVAPETSLPPELDTWLVDSSTTIRCSYNINSLSRIHTVLRAISQMQVSVKRVHNSIEDKLLSSQEKSRKLAAREDLDLKVGQLKNELAWQMNKLQHQKDVLDNCIKAKEERNHSLKKDFHHLERDRVSLEEKKKSYYQIRERYIKENYQLLIRRKQLITELTTYIYPITEVKEGRLCVCNVYLPNSEQFQGQDDMKTSVALGYTCHLVEMMSQILDFPLRYPMHHNSSRSTITDHIHSKLTEKDKTFPLYGKGKEKFQFNYGVFLLNKNISQLRFYCGLGTTDLRLTLPNIKTLLELRLGIKFDSHEIGRARLDFKDNMSIPSDGKTETLSSLASGGKNSAKHPEEMELERELINNKQGQEMDPKSVNKENIPVHLNEVNGKNEKHVPSDSDELFQPSEDNFFKLKLTTFNNDSANNSSCGSFSEQANGMMSFSRNFSLSPSPGSGENNISTENNVSGENDLMLVNHSIIQGAESKTSLGSCDELSFGEEILDNGKAPPSGPVCDSTNVTDSNVSSDITLESKDEGKMNGHST